MSEVKVFMSLFESLSLEEHGEQLIQLALNHDSKDNISVLIAAIEGDRL